MNIDQCICFSVVTKSGKGVKSHSKCVKTAPECSNHKNIMTHNLHTFTQTNIGFLFSVEIFDEDHIFVNFPCNDKGFFSKMCLFL